MTTEPPSYETSVAAQCDAAHMQEPVILVLAGQSIRAESADAPKLYEMNRGVANLGHATTEVELTRLERRVQATEDDDADAEDKEGAAKQSVSPRVKIRRRHIFDLVHPTNKGGAMMELGEKAVGAPTYYMKPWTKTTHAGTYGLKKSHLRTQWKVLPVLLGNDNGNYGEPKYQDKAKPLFQVTKGRTQEDAYEWKDEEGKPLAVEDCRREEGQGEGEEGRREYRLLTTRPMERNLLDALVAMWCCRVWEEAATGQPPVHEGMEKVHRRFRLGKLGFPRAGTNNFVLGVAGASAF